MYTTAAPLRSPPGKEQTSFQMVQQMICPNEWVKHNWVIIMLGTCAAAGVPSAQHKHFRPAAACFANFAAVPQQNAMAAGQQQQASHLLGQRRPARPAHVLWQRHACNFCSSFSSLDYTNGSSSATVQQRTSAAKDVPPAQRPRRISQEIAALCDL